MDSMQRRSFLKLAGLTAGGLVIPTALSSAEEEVLPNKVYLPSVSNCGITPSVSESVTVIVTPSKFEVSTAKGLGLGSLSVDILQEWARAIDVERMINGLHHFNLPHKDEPSQQSAGDTGRTPDLARVLKDVPSLLVPITLHPLLLSDGVNENYVQTIRIITQEDVGATISANPPRQGEVVTPEGNVVGRVGNYVVSAGYSWGYVGGCIRRTQNHANLRVHYAPPGQPGRQLRDYHAVGWWDGWRPCFGLYESETGRCWSTCTWWWWDALWIMFYVALLGVVVWWIAQALATMMTAAALGLLTAIPGVPPPP